MYQSRLLIVLGTICSINLSLFSLAFAVEKQTTQLSSSQTGENEEQKETGEMNELILDEALDSLFQPLNLELSLENKTLTEEDFISHFGENGFYEEVESLSLSGSSFNPAWLEMLPKTLSSIKIRAINTERFREHGFPSKSSMLIEIVRRLHSSLPNMKSLDISENLLRPKSLEAMVQHLCALDSLDISRNFIGMDGAKVIAENLSSLQSLNISENGIGTPGAFVIAIKLTSLQSLNASRNFIGNTGAKAIADNLRSLRSLYISQNFINNAYIATISENLPSLDFFDFSGNPFTNTELSGLSQNFISLILQWCSNLLPLVQMSWSDELESAPPNIWDYCPDFPALAAER